jgi:hypothetical protein
MSEQCVASALAHPFHAIFEDEAEAHWGFDFLQHTFDLLNARANDYRPTAITLPKSHKWRLLRFNFGPWLLVDFCGPRSTYGKRINLALITDDRAVDPRKKWFAFNYPHDKRGVSVYQFTWPEIKHMDAALENHYATSMHYTGELIGKWKGSPYRLAHQPQIMAAVFDATVRADLLQNGLDPFYKEMAATFTMRCDRRSA